MFNLQTDLKLIFNHIAVRHQKYSCKTQFRLNSIYKTHRGYFYVTAHFRVTQPDDMNLPRLPLSSLNLSA